MRTGILLFEQFTGKKGMGSSRIRGHWIVKHWQEAGVDLGTCELFKHGGDYDAVIYQKAYFVKHAQGFKGIKIFDICDPDWLHWSYQVREMIDACDAITTSTLELAKFIASMTDKPIAFIPDRIDLSILPPRKEQAPTVKKALWYGYSDNFPILESCVPILSRMGLELIVVSNDLFYLANGNKMSLTNLPWSEHYLKDIQKADVVLNPKFNKGKWKYKSDNKTSLAWALGIPVAETETDLKKICEMTQAQREAESISFRAKAEKEYDVKLSVAEYKDLIVELQHARKAENENL